MNRECSLVCRSPLRPSLALQVAVGARERPRPVAGIPVVQVVLAGLPSPSGTRPAGGGRSGHGQLPKACVSSAVLPASSV
eukprot:5517131-Lingulodinium_polyedra.AAC.1